MKTTKTIIYAFACIQELAKRAGQCIQVSEIALAQNIPVAYCQKVLCALAKAGIVLSVKGQGFTLIQSPQSLSTLKVMEAMSENSPSESAIENTAMKSLSESFTEKVNRTLAGLTVAEVLVGSR